jgi:hypothetical protein
MEAMLGQITPVQMFFMFAIQLWVVVIFPVMVFRKLNYLTELVESQFEDEAEENQT